MLVVARKDQAVVATQRLREAVTLMPAEAIAVVTSDVAGQGLTAAEAQWEAVAAAAEEEVIMTTMMMRRRAVTVAGSVRRLAGTERKRRRRTAAGLARGRGATMRKQLRTVQRLPLLSLQLHLLLSLQHLLLLPLCL